MKLRAPAQVLKGHCEAKWPNPPKEDRSRRTRHAKRTQEGSRPESEDE